jgi:hypothetical protein
MVTVHKMLFRDASRGPKTSFKSISHLTKSTHHQNISLFTCTWQVGECILTALAKGRGKMNVHGDPSVLHCILKVTVFSLNSGTGNSN